MKKEEATIGTLVAVKTRGPYFKTGKIVELAGFGDWTHLLPGRARVLWNRGNMRTWIQISRLSPAPKKP